MEPPVFFEHLGETPVQPCGVFVVGQQCRQGLLVLPAMGVGPRPPVVMVLDHRAVLVPPQAAYHLPHGVERMQHVRSLGPAFAGVLPRFVPVLFTLPFGTGIAPWCGLVIHLFGDVHTVDLS